MNRRNYFPRPNAHKSKRASRMEHDALYSLGLERWLAMDEKSLIRGLLVVIRPDISNLCRSTRWSLNSKAMNIVVGSTGI